MAPLSPTVARWELMLRIKRRRTEFHVTGSVIAKELGFTLSYWSKVEKERVLAEDKLRALLRLLEFVPEEREEMLRLRDIAKRRGWWSEYAGLVPDEAARLYGLEYGARDVRSYTSIVLPELLQTEDYARAVLANDRARVRQVDIDRWVQVRMRRQERLTGAEPLRLTAIVHQAALTQRTGGADVVKGQLRHMLAVAEHYADVVDIRVIPFDAPGGVLLAGGSFQLIGFDSALLPDVAWTETLLHGDVVEEAEPVRHLAMMFDTTLAEHALSREDSISLLERALDALEP
ncbi:DUF5753 domain-containing protein [Nocardia sp. 004]|uniref:DUF5753 domain-containing protein n=1 Tax=Nocardia sp. 004 TaxID=3385978 RepID=UPI00399F6082